MKNATSQDYMVNKLLKIGRNLAWLGAVMFAGMAVGLELFRQLRRVATKRRGDDYYGERDRDRPRHTVR